MALSNARECPIDCRQRMQQQSAPVGLDSPAPLQGSKMRQQQEGLLRDAESGYGEAPLFPRNLPLHLGDFSLCSGTNVDSNIGSDSRVRGLKSRLYTRYRS